MHSSIGEETAKISTVEVEGLDNLFGSARKRDGRDRSQLGFPLKLWRHFTAPPSG